MKTLLYTASVTSYAVAVAVGICAETALHEVIATLWLVDGTIALVGASVIGALRKVDKGDPPKVE